MSNTEKSSEPVPSEQKLDELARLCKEMLEDRDTDECGKPSWMCIYAIEDKLKEWGYMS